MRLPLTLRRLIFNLLLPLRLWYARYDLVVGFDWDGVFLRGWGLGTRNRRWLSPILGLVSHVPGPSFQAPGTYICSIKGIVAEELQHERGRIRVLFHLLARLEGANARRADRVITTSEYCRRKIVEHYDVPDARVGIVPEGIDVGNWGSETTPHAPRFTSVSILCVARQYPRKHIRDLLQAFALIRERVPSARLRVVGDGPEHAKLRTLAQQLDITPKVTFLGSIGDDEVKREYAQCDIFCLPSVQEGFGIVFLEAMAAGKPVVSTTAAAIPEVVQHGRTGILVPPGDVRSLAGALFVLLTDDERRERYGAAGRQRVEMYDWRRVVEQFLKEVEMVSEPQARRRRE
jgi:glycosyltransferase involved in cell wall biosynthesis